MQKIILRMPAAALLAFVALALPYASSATRAGVALALHGRCSPH